MHHHQQQQQQEIPTTTQINPYTSTKILLQDGISALQQDNDTSKALTHLKLAYQQLTSIGENSSTVQPTKILLQDGISALQQDNDTSKTLVYMKLAYQQLSAPSNTVLPSSSSAVSNHVGRDRDQEVKSMERLKEE